MKMIVSDEVGCDYPNAFCRFPSNTFYSCPSLPIILKRSISFQPILYDAMSNHPCSTHPKPMSTVTHCYAWRCIDKSFFGTFGKTVDARIARPKDRKEWARNTRKLHSARCGATTSALGLRNAVIIGRWLRRWDRKSASAKDRNAPVSGIELRRKNFKKFSSFTTTLTANPYENCMKVNNDV